MRWAKARPGCSTLPVVRVIRTTATRVTLRFMALLLHSLPIARVRSRAVTVQGCPLSNRCSGVAWMSTVRGGRPRGLAPVVKRLSAERKLLHLPVGGGDIDIAGSVHGDAGGTIVQIPGGLHMAAGRELLDSLVAAVGDVDVPRGMDG